MHARIGLMLILALGAAGGLVNAAQADAPPVSGADRAFVAAASASNATEIAFAKEAIENGDTATQTFARTMIRDHTKLGAKLTSAARPLELKLNTTPSPKQGRMIAKVVKLKGAAFDRSYRVQQVAAHKATLAIFQQEAAHGKATTLKAVAKAAIPTIKMHLGMAERLVAAGAKP